MRKEAALLQYQFCGVQIYGRFLLNVGYGTLCVLVHERGSAIMLKI